MWDETKMEYGPKIGLDSVYVAALTEGSDTSLTAPSFSTPLQLAGAAKMTGNPNGSLITDWGDNGPFFVTNSRGNLQATLELIDIHPTVLAMILGQTKANGIVQEGAFDQAPWYALGFRVWIGGTESGNKIYEYFWYLKGKFTIPQQGATTKKATISPEHTSLTAEFAKTLYNDVMCTHARSNDPDVSSTLVSAWFNAPVVATTINTSAVAVAIAKSSGNITFTFTKGDSSTFKMAEASAIVGNSILVIETGASVGGAIAWTGEGTASVVGTYTPSTTLSGTVLATCTKGVQDANGVAVTPLTVSLTF